MTRDALEMLRSRKDDLVGGITGLLEKNMFSSSYTLSPFMFGELAESVAEGLLTYLADANDETTFALGERLAEIGLAGRTVAEFASVLRAFAIRVPAASPPDSVEALLSPIDGYFAALVDGFVTGHDNHVLQEQERTRRALEAANKTALHELRLKSSTFDNSSAAIAVIDHSSTVIYANRAMAELLGLAAPGEVEGRSLSDSIDGAGLERALDLAKNGKSWHGEVSLKTATSEGLSAVLAVSPVDGTGEPFRAMVVGILAEN